MMIKGTAIRARVEYLRERFGDEGLERLVGALSPEYGRVLREAILISKWYPGELNDEILGTAERLFGREDGKLCRELGAASCELGMRTVYSNLAQTDDIGRALTRFTSVLWKNYYDEGWCDGRQVGEGHVRLELFAKLEKDWTCHIIAGFVEAALRIWGVSHCHVGFSPPRLGTLDEPASVFEFHWE